MFIRKVSEFATFLGLREHSVDEILSHLIHRVFVELEATSIFVSALDRRNRIEMLGQHGMDPDVWQVYPQGTSLFDKYPITDALRTRRTIWINTLPDWGKDYPLLAPYKFPLEDKTFICVPIEKCDTPVAVMGFFCRSEIQLDAELDSYVGAVSNLLSLYLYRSDDSWHPGRNSSRVFSVGQHGLRDEELTERQLLILRMLSENRTNILISELLGYSESTIKQETIKIYAKLGCNGREEASRIYKDKFKETESLSS
jgi:DNA-binding CsgD family transcriptional regulator